MQTQSKKIPASEYEFDFGVPVVVFFMVFLQPF